MNALSIDEAALDVNTKKRPTGYDTKVKAKAAAVATIGEHARDGFEFEVFKVDGRWQWRAFDVVKPPTAAEIKAMGGKRAFSKAADQARHEERGAERAKQEGRLRDDPEKSVVAAIEAKAAKAGPVIPGRQHPAPSLVAMAQQISGTAKPEAVALADLHATEQGRANAASWDAIPAVRAAGKKARRRAAGAPKASEATVEAPAQENVLGTVYGAGQPLVVNDDGLDLPEFLKRPKQTEEEKEALRKKLAKTVGPERVIKNPPNVKDAKARAAKRAPVSVRKDGLVFGSAMAKLVDRVCHPKGATNQQLCEAVGWKQCLPCMHKACAKAGIKVRVEKKKGEAARYFGTAT